MHIFAIGDLHLSLSAPKPMDIFGECWRDHDKKIKSAWEASVADGDWVLIPGDVSWAMRLSDALPDLLFLSELPGQKLLLRGNHDFWWSSRTKVEASLPPSLHLLQNDCRMLGDVAVCGTRGWACPGSSGFSAQDQKVYERELQRLELSLKSAPEGAEKLVMLHFPPLNDSGQPTGFTELLERYGVRTAVYAHLHGAAHRHAFTGERNGVLYRFSAADALEFAPTLIR